LNSQSALFMALAANLTFALASIGYSHFSKKISAIWVTYFKCLCALIFICISLFFIEIHKIDLMSVVLLMFSGVLGLAIGDSFLLNAYKMIGPARTLFLFCFQPLLISTGAFFLFGQQLTVFHGVAIALFMLSVFLISLDGLDKSKSNWQLKGVGLAFLAVCFDAFGGVLVTRWVFEKYPDLHPIESNCYRSLGAVIVFFIASLFYKELRIIPVLRKISFKAKSILISCAFLGTFLALIFYVFAIKFGNLGAISAIAITGPLFLSAIDIVRGEQKISRYFVLSSMCFVVAFLLMNYPYIKTLLISIK